jgi:hypothetical protein
MKPSWIFILTAILGALALGFLHRFSGWPGEPERVVTDPTVIMSSREELVYEVRWTVFKLGTVRIMSTGDYEAKARIDSYDGVPFVDLHSVYYTKMDSSLFSREAYSIDKVENEWRGLSYLYDPQKKRVTVEATYHTDPTVPPYKKELKHTIDLPSGSFLDGLSIAYLPRTLIHMRRSVKVATVLNGKVGYTTFHFTGKRTTERIDALDGPVPVIEVKGSTTAEGIYGMTGDFTGWFADDATGVPIKGKLKVLLGSVSVELIQWKRGSWNPPIALRD